MTQLTAIQLYFIVVLSLLVFGLAVAGTGVVPMSTKRPLVIVRWKDARADGSWGDAKEFHKPANCYSVGWIWVEDDEGLTLAANYSPDDDHSHTTGNLQYILKSTIVERKIVRKAQK